MNLKTLVVKRNDQYPTDKIEEFVLKHENSNVFQSIEMFNFYSCVDGYTPFYIICECDKKELKGVMLGVVVKNKGLLGIKEHFSSRCLIVGGPLAAPSPQQIVSKMLICLNGFNYSKTHKHPAEVSESYHMIEGKIDIIFFDDACDCPNSFIVANVKNDN